MTDTKQTIRQLQAHIKVLEEENASLVEGAEDFLLLGSISDAVSAETSVEAMFDTVLEKVALLKGIDLAAVCRARDKDWRIEHSYDGRTDENCNGLLLQLLTVGEASDAGARTVSGADCQKLLGADYPLIREILLLPFEVEIYGRGYLLLAVANRRGDVLRQCRNLFVRALEILMMHISNRLLFQNYQAANIALEQKIAEQNNALKTSEERFRTVIDRASEGFFLHDDAGRFLQVNVQACKSLGYSKDELLQMRIEDIDESFDHGKVKIFLAGFNSSNYQQIRSFHRRKDGHRFPVEINVSRVKLGEDYYFLALVRDLSRQLEAEELQKKFDLLLDNVPDMVCMANPDGRIIYLNQAAKNLFAIDDVTNKSLYFADLMPPQSARAQADRVSTAIDKGIWVGEGQLLAANQEVIPTLQTVVAPKNKLGEVENIFCIERDLRDLRRLEEQFIQAQKMEAVGTLVGGIAHDFNNLLAGIMGNIFLLLRNSENDSQQERLKTVQQMCQSAAEMVAQLLVFARKDAVSIEPLNLGSFMADFGKMYQVLIPENIRFELGEIADDLAILTDLSQFQQIMVNLLTNARDALEGCVNPTIGVSIERFDATETFLLEHPSLKQTQLIRISIIDNGCGIPTDVQASIFDPFFTSKEVDKGTGLGLAMVYGAVKRQQGAIEVVSNPGEGTIMRLYLPRVETSVVSSLAAELDEGIIYGQGELLILADDDEFVRESHRDALVQLGYRVLSAADGQQALDMYQDCPQVALVICDVVMPNLDGMTAGRKMRDINADLPLLYMSGYADKTEKHGNLPEGAEILNKPASIELLSRKVAKLLHHR